MNIRPQDLGPKWQMHLLEQRAAISSGMEVKASRVRYPRTRVGALGRWWTHGLDLSPEATAATLAGFKRSGSAGIVAILAALMESGVIYIAESYGQEGHPITAMTVGIVGTCLTALWIAFPKVQILGVVRKPLTTEEMLVLTKGAQDPLERSYFGLLQEVRQQTLTPEAASGLRGALQALGQALSQLPPNGAIADFAALRETAAQKQTEADGETDAVVAASLGRQAAALRRSADTTERSARLMRRTVALRDELSAQIESLRLGLTSFQTSSGDMSGLTDLAEAVQTVAVQAASLAEARTELETALEEKPLVTADAPSVPQMLRIGGS